VYAIAGANVVFDRSKQSGLWQQGFLGMGVGTTELVPFWRMCGWMRNTGDMIMTTAIVSVLTGIPIRREVAMTGGTWFTLFVEISFSFLIWRNNVQNSLSDIVTMSVTDAVQHGFDFFGIDAPEFYTHAGGQIITIHGAPSDNPDTMTATYLTPRATATFTASGGIPDTNHTGFYRNPLPLSDGTLVAVHTAETHSDSNQGTRANPVSLYYWDVIKTPPDTSVDQAAMLPEERLFHDLRRSAVRTLIRAGHSSRPRATRS
jgi:hypothetical protein